MNVCAFLGSKTTEHESFSAQRNARQGAKHRKKEGDRMEKHLGFLGRRCRLCGKTFSKVQTVQNCDKTAFGRELLNFFGVDIGLDSREIHPQKVCSACRRVVYHLNSGNLDPETSEGRKQGIKLFLLKEHSSNCYCLQKLKGRPSKKELCNNANQCNFRLLN
ncbi:unnamed protein product [Porites lobata]|uniref:Uncharacterized protein n=1 Tax=Porites lobata TaxID=104759 RepID=A0ABN8N201_9CNID|nr:unnamed protein product [Porites lobata]